MKTTQHVYHFFPCRPQQYNGQTQYAPHPFLVPSSPTAATNPLSGTASSPQGALTELTLKSNFRQEQRGSIVHKPDIYYWEILSLQCKLLFTIISNKVLLSSEPHFLLWASSHLSLLPTTCGLWLGIRVKLKGKPVKARLSSRAEDEPSSSLLLFRQQLVREMIDNDAFCTLECISSYLLLSRLPGQTNTQNKSIISVLNPQIINKWQQHT